MIEIEMRDMLNSMEVLQKLSNKSLKTKVAFQLARIIREVNKEYELFQNSREKLIVKYAEQDENGQPKVNEQNNYQIIPNKINEFNKEIQELLDSHIEINAEPIYIDDIEDLNFTPTEMMMLMSFIKE